MGEKQHAVIVNWKTRKVCFQKRKGAFFLLGQQGSEGPEFGSKNQVLQN